MLMYLIVFDLFWAAYDLKTGNSFIWAVSQFKHTRVFLITQKMFVREDGQECV